MKSKIYTNVKIEKTVLKMFSVLAETISQIKIKNTNKIYEKNKNRI